LHPCKNREVNLLGAEAFVTVVNLGTLQKAADRLGVSSATISRRLTELETELGVRLLERTTRSLRVTELGRAFHERCTRGLDAIAAAGDLVASKGTRVSGTVRVSTAPSLGRLLVGALAHIRRAHPEVHVVLVETERLLDPYADDIDLFVRAGAVAEDRLVARRLGTYPHVLVASRDYVAAAGAPVLPEDLVAHRILGFGPRRRIEGLDLFPARGGDPVHVRTRPSLSSNDYTTITHAARSGLGIAEVPAILCEPRAGLVRILPDWTLGENTLHLLFAADRLLPRTVRVVIDAILATVPSQIGAATASLGKP
jgi:DNA-binding transcriptional LysR family regulator